MSRLKETSLLIFCQMSPNNVLYCSLLGSDIFVSIYGSTADLNVPTFTTCISTPNFSNNLV